MEITEVRIRLRDDEKLRAFVSVTFDHCFVVQGMKIINGSRGPFVAMPSRRRPDGSFQDICHPLDSTTRAWLEKTILDEYNATLDNPDEEGREMEVLRSPGGD